jgi:tetratricopeptide (TPR) repeat protein
MDAPAAPDRFAQENERAEQFIQQGQLPEAAQVLVGIVEQNPTDARAYNNMGILSWMQKAWNDAYTMFKRSVELKPTYSDALVNLFDASLKLHKAREILPLFKEALEQDPSLEDIRIIAESIEQQSDEDIYSSERALMIGPYNPGIEEADKLLQEGQINQAMAKYIEVNDQEGPNAAAFNGLGIISYYQERYEDAFTLFLESIKLNPVDPDKFLNLLDAARAIGKTEEAKKIYEIYARDLTTLRSIGGEFEDESAASDVATREKQNES